MTLYIYILMHTNANLDDDSYIVFFFPQFKPLLWHPHIIFTDKHHKVSIDFVHLLKQRTIYGFV